MNTVFSARLNRTLCLCGLAGLLLGQTTDAGVLTFKHDLDTFDDNMDGFITGTEFDPAGTDGVQFTFEPINNLVGMPRVFISEANGLHFGGGGGSSLEIDFMTDTDISLESYTISSTGFILNDPTFNIEEGLDVLSLDNTAVSSGDTHNFANGPISIEAGTTYTFNVTNTGAGIQSFLDSWDYTVVPEPSSFGLLALGVAAAASRERRNYSG